MKTEADVDQMLIKIVKQLPELEKMAKPYEMGPIYGIIDALRWVTNRPSNVESLFNSKDERKALDISRN
jgi:hypothetical protein